MSGVCGSIHASKGTHSNDGFQHTRRGKIQFANRSRKSTSGHRGTGWGALLAETEVMAPEGGRSHVESLAD